MTYKKLLIITLIYLSQAAYAAHDNAYFRHLKFRETPFSPYQGIHPIDKKEAKETAHYRFEYDDQGRVTSVAHMIGKQIINDNGNWDTFIWFAPKVSMTYKKHQEIHHYHNTKDERISAHGKVYQATYQLNSEGKRISLSFTDEQGQASENAWGINRYQWQHKDAQNIIEKRFDLKNTQKPLRPVFPFYETHMTFDHKGQIQFMKNYGTESQPTNNDSGAGIDRIFYDLEGNFQRWHVYDKDGKPVNGNRPMVHIGEHLYDDKGNKIGMRGFNPQGQQIKFSWGDFEIRNQYDKFGNQVQSQVLNESGKQSHRITVEYSKNGLRREWLKAYNAENQLSASPMLSGAAALKYQYADDDLIPSGRVPYDKELKKLPQQN
ncbi:hypothetical protein [Marinicella rhabdoformis]|uniref:hypothetical protein n=1 Tax=Marinicella rhabdoformis TaxID=2580566 RepID=UPI0012AEB669|nr:hypothetical protein [Marinicella rhabdoformis]